jgi:hypothetical protein
MKKIAQGKLRLGKETLTNLSKLNLADVAGGTSSTGTTCYGQGGWSMDTLCITGCYCPNME